MSAFLDQEVDFVIGVSSVGSCNTTIFVGSIVVPDDYVSHCEVSSLYDDARGHIVPGYDEELRQMLIAAIHEIKTNSKLKFVERAVYVQTRGPRFETKAEVNISQENLTQDTISLFNI